MDSMMEEAAPPGLTPSDEYLHLYESMQQLRISNYGVQALSLCLRAAHRILKQGPRMRQQDLDMVRKMLSEELLFGCERCFQDNNFLNQLDPRQSPAVYETAYWLTRVVCDVLVLRTHPSSGEIWGGIDADLVTLVRQVYPVLTLLNPPQNFNPLHHWTTRTPLPHHVAVVDHLEFGVLWEHVGEDGQPLIFWTWLAYLLEEFGKAGGFTAMGQLVSTAGNVSIGLLCALVDLMAAMATPPMLLKENVTADLLVALAGVASQLQQLAVADDAQLSDAGADRTYRCFHLLAERLLRLFNNQSIRPNAEACTQVQAAQRAFIQNMLSSKNPTYNKVLSGVRECNALLQHQATALPAPAAAEGQLAEEGSRSALQETAVWMEENEIVQRMLRSNLHQRQYVEQVSMALGWLTRERLLTSKHIDMIWAVTEQEDAYEAVRTNVYDMLSQLASDFSPDQLDMLFSKFSSRQDQPLLDSIKRAELLLKLAQSEANSNQYIMEDKIRNMMWDLVMPSTAPPELLPRMVDVIAVYTKHQPQLRCAYMQRCVLQVQQSQGWVLNCLRLLVELVAEEEEAVRKSAAGRQEQLPAVVDKRWFPVLISKICRLAAAAAPVLQQHAAAVAPADAGQVPPAAAAEAVLPSDGGWQYEDIIHQYAEALCQFAAIHSEYFSSDLASRLWEGAVVPLLKLPTQDMVLRFFIQGVVGTKRGFMEPYFDGPTCLQLLEHHLTRVDPLAVTSSMSRLFMQCFEQAVKTADGAKDDKDSLRVVHSGVDFLWRVYLQHPHNKVASSAREALLGMYKEHRAGLTMQNLVSTVVDQLRSNTQQLDEGHAGAARAVLRCLNIANFAIGVGNQTMPPLPAHATSWRGAPVSVDVQLSPAQRVKLACHSNQYIGGVRCQVAQLMGCSPKNIRMLAFGKEWLNDAETLGQLDMRSRGAVVSVIQSPVENQFTQLPDEYRPEWEATSATWMLMQQPGLYPLLLHLVDHPSAPGMGSTALRLLEQLPTCPELPRQLRRALLAPNRQAELHATLTSSSTSSRAHPGTDCGDSKPSSHATSSTAAELDTPHQALYSLQALCALLFPSMQQELLGEAAAGGAGQDEAMADAEAKAADTGGSAADVDGPADANAEVIRVPSSGSSEGGKLVGEGAVSDGKGKEGAAAGVGTVATGTATSAAADAPFTKQQLEQLRRVMLEGGCLEEVVDVSARIAASSSTTLTLLRQLAQLLVLLIQHLMEDVSSSAAAGGSGAGAGNPAAAAEQVSGSLAHLQQQQHALQLEQPPAAAASSVERPPLPPGSAALTVVPPSSPSPESMCISTTTPPLTPLGCKQTRDRHPVLPSPTTSGGGALAGAAGGAGAGGASGSTGAPSSSVLSLRTAQLLMDLPLQLAVHTSQLWGMRDQEPYADDENNVDVQIVNQALALLLQLLELQPLQLKPLLAAPPSATLRSRSSNSSGGGVSPLISQLLLCPHYTAVRSSARSFLAQLARFPVNQSQPLFWLLQQLLAARPSAAAAAAESGHYYELFCEVVSLLPNSAAPAGAFQLAEQLLGEEVAALQQPQPAADVLGSEDVALQGRLQLLLTLVRSLDRRSVGVGVGTSLIQLLLTQYLFPEAQLQLDLCSGSLDLSRCAAQLVPCCSAPECRHAAFELLSELMQDSVSSLEEGVRLILMLHPNQRDRALQDPTRAVVPRPMREPGQYMGLRNGGATCYMNAVVQQLFMQPRIRQLVLSADAVPAVEAPESVFAQLQALFGNLALNKAGSFFPIEFWRAFKDYDGQPIDVKEHQDAYEFFTRLQDYVDQHLVSTQQQPAIQRVMGGRFVQQVICRGHDFKSEREEEFYQISVDVRGMGTLEKSLEMYVQGELLEGDNAYYCEELGKRVTAVKRTCISQLPHTLCVHLKRFEFDFHTQTRYKVRDRFEFPATIDMFKYTAEGLALQEQQAAAAGAESGGGGGPALAHRASTSSGSTLAAAAAAAAAGGGAAEGPAAGQQHLYDLKGVVVHMGSAFTGHYYSYIKERSSWKEDGSLSEGQWLCFDDKSVLRWDERNLEADCFGGRAAQDSDGGGAAAARLPDVDRSHSAYMLFYERRWEQHQDADALLVAQAAAPPPPATAAADSSGVAAPSAMEISPRPGGAPPLAAAAAAGGTSRGAAAAAAVQQGDPAAAGPTTAAAAAAAAAGEGGPTDMEVAGAAAGGVPGSTSDGFVPPYGMPLELYRRVMSDNIRLVWVHHVIDREYFRFIRSLLTCSDAAPAASKKSRRKDPLPPPAAATAEEGASPPQQQGGAGGTSSQPQSGDVAGGEDGAGSAPAAEAGSTQQEQQQQQLALGPSGSSRAEQEAQAALLLTELGMYFFFNIHLHAGNHFRQDGSAWVDALIGLLRSSPECLALGLRLLGQAGHYAQAAFRAAFSSLTEQSRSCAKQLLDAAVSAALHKCSASHRGSSAGVRQLLEGPLQMVLYRLVDGIQRIGVEELDVLWPELIGVVQLLSKASRKTPHLMRDILASTQLIAALAGLVVDADVEDLEDDMGADTRHLYSALADWLSDCENWPMLVIEYNQQDPNDLVLWDHCPLLASEEEADGWGFSLNSDAFTTLMDTRLLRRLLQDIDSLVDEHAQRLAGLLMWGNLPASSNAALAMQQQLWMLQDSEELELYLLAVGKLLLLDDGMAALRVQRFWFGMGHNPRGNVSGWTFVVRQMHQAQAQVDHAETNMWLMLKLLQHCMRNQQALLQLASPDAFVSRGVLEDLFRVLRYLQDGPVNAAQQHILGELAHFHQAVIGVFNSVAQQQGAREAAAAAAAVARQQEMLQPVAAAAEPPAPPVTAAEAAAAVNTFDGLLAADAGELNADLDQDLDPELEEEVGGGDGGGGGSSKAGDE